MPTFDPVSANLARSRDGTRVNISAAILAVNGRDLIIAGLIAVLVVVRPVRAEALVAFVASTTSIERCGLPGKLPPTLKKRTAIDFYAVTAGTGQAHSFSENADGVATNKAEPRFQQHYGTDLKMTNNGAGYYKEVGWAIQEAIRRQEILRGHARGSPSPRCR